MEKDHDRYAKCNMLYIQHTAVLYIVIFCPLGRDGVSGGTGPRSLSDTAGLRSVPKHREGLPFRVSGQLRGRDLLLRPPPQQTQEIHLPMHRRILFCTGGGKGCQVWLHKMSILKTKKKKYILTPPSFWSPLFCFTFFVSVGLMFFPSKEIMDYCKIKNKPIFYYEAEKKRKKIDFRIFFFFAIILGTVTFLITFFPWQNHLRPEWKANTPCWHISLFCVFVPFFYVVFWTASTHLTWTLWRWDKVSQWRRQGVSSLLLLPYSVPHKHTHYHSCSCSFTHTHTHTSH